MAAAAGGNVFVDGRSSGPVMGPRSSTGDVGRPSWIAHALPSSSC